MNNIKLCLLGFCLTSCAALSRVTPADRAAAYAREAQAVRTVCKGYEFDRSVGLVGEVPEMAALCK